MSVEIKNRDPEEACHNDRNENRSSNECCCLSKRLRYIDYIQRKYFKETCCLSCESSHLGGNIPGVNNCNTRPFYLYLPDGSLFSITDPITEATYDVFRVEEVHDGCAVVRALSLSFTGSTLDTAVYTASYYCATIDICKFIGLQCLPDTYIPC